MTTSTLTLTAFLLARIAEDEYEANVCLDQYARGDGGSTPRWHRQLAECKAKRAIVERATELAEHDDMGSSTRDDGAAILSALASVYADHPDFNPAWS